MILFLVSRSYFSHGILLNIRWHFGWEGSLRGRMDTCINICVAESLGCSYKTITTLLLGYENENLAAPVLSNSL